MSVNYNSPIVRSQSQRRGFDCDNDSFFLKNRIQTPQKSINDNDIDNVKYLTENPKQYNRNSMSSNDDYVDDKYKYEQSRNNFKNSNTNMNMESMSHVSSRSSYSNYKKNPSWENTQSTYSNHSLSTRSTLNKGKMPQPIYQKHIPQDVYKRESRIIYPNNEPLQLSYFNKDIFEISDNSDCNKITIRVLPFGKKSFFQVNNSTILDSSQLQQISRVEGSFDESVSEYDTITVHFEDKTELFIEKCTLSMFSEIMTELATIVEKQKKMNALVAIPDKKKLKKKSVWKRFFL